jgi:hypothetical protein
MNDEYQPRWILFCEANGLPLDYWPGHGAEYIAWVSRLASEYKTIHPGPIVDHDQFTEWMRAKAGAA